MLINDVKGLIESYRTSRGSFCCGRDSNEIFWTNGKKVSQWRVKKEKDVYFDILILFWHNGVLYGNSWGRNIFHFVKFSWQKTENHDIYKYIDEKTTIVWKSKQITHSQTHIQITGTDVDGYIFSEVVHKKYRNYGYRLILKNEKVYCFSRVSKCNQVFDLQTEKWSDFEYLLNHGENQIFWHNDRIYKIRQHGDKLLLDSCELDHKK